MGSLKNETESLLQEEEEEPILKEQSQKYCTFPIRYPQLWEMYKKAVASFWSGNPYIFCSCFFFFHEIVMQNCVTVLYLFIMCSVFLQSLLLYMVFLAGIVLFVSPFFVFVNIGIWLNYLYVSELIMKICVFSVIHITYTYLFVYDELMTFSCKICSA